MYDAPVEWLNYHHLFYFWIAAREGSISRACEILSLAQPTISGQIHALERALGEKLFRRVGRHLALTDVGHLVQRYADEIFSRGEELKSVLRGREPGRPLRLVVGVADVVPKLVAYWLLESAFSLPQPVHIVCWEGKLDRLLAELAIHGLDLVLADEPVPSNVKVQAFNHPLGESGVSLFAAADLAAKCRRRFPRSLDAAPFLLPTTNTTLRRALDDWFASRNLRPRIVGEFEDSATLKAFGHAGRGIFPGSSVMEREIVRQYDVKVVGRADGITQRFYAITVERRLKHPAVLAISSSAHRKLKRYPA